jgi:hypothetical protein
MMMTATPPRTAEVSTVRGTEPGPPQNLYAEVIQHLAEDYSWLEQHALSHGVKGQEVTRLRLTRAVVANSLGPFLRHVTPPPLHIVVVGGAGAGKSTLVNFLIGAAVAETNPQAGFTRHPVAYTLVPNLLPWFAGDNPVQRLRRLDYASPANLDEDVFQIRAVSVPDESRSVLPHAIVWDAPDMTTWQASGYVGRLLEVLGLADLVIYAASDERYNDTIPTQYLHMVLQAGKPVITCLLKMQESQADALVDHFRTEIVARLPECTKVSACLAIPYLSAEELADPLGKAQRFREPLFQAVRWWIERPLKTRQEVVRHEVEYLESSEESLLSLARQDLQALETWREVVQKGEQEFTTRYVKEHLTGEQFPRFNEALVRLIQLMELPGWGQLVSKTLWAVRLPYRWLKDLVSKAASAAPSAKLPEEPVLTAGFDSWLNLLRREIAARQDTHPIWMQIKQGFVSNLPELAREQFQHCLRNFQVQIAQDVERTAKAIYEDLEKNPAALNMLRGTKFSLEALTIGGTIASLGATSLVNLAAVPLVASLTQEMIEFLGKQYVDHQREKTRARQKELFRQTLVEPLAKWLVNWPTTGGSTLERLQVSLKRIPENVRLLAQAARRHMENRDA